MKVPIQNVYYLLCYACAERVLAVQPEPVGVSEGPDSLPNLLAFVLMQLLKPLIRRGVDRGYLPVEEETSVPRGRIEFGPTVTGCAPRRRRVVCRWDELDTNILHNQVLRTTARILANSNRVDPLRRLEFARIERLLYPVDVIRPDHGVFRRIVLHRNNSQYRLPLQICELVWLNLLPDPSEVNRGRKFDAIRDDDRAMERIFEQFIGNFCRIEMPRFDVRTQQKLDWDVGEGSDTAYLPEMRADAVLHSRQPDRLLVVDAKYYRDALVEYYERERVRSDHLYQMTAYLRSIQMKDTEASGLLLYPQSGGPVRACFVLSGRRLLVHTLDLSLPWQEIHRALYQLILECAS